MASNIFTGASRYATDFQSVIDRSVNIASLPMLQMQQSRATTSDQSTAVQALDSKVTSLQTALKSLGDSFGFGSYSVSNSDASIVTTRIADGVSEGTYTVKVLDVGSYATATSKSNLTVVTDPATQSISSAEEFSLFINDGEEITLHPASNNLNSLVEAINNANAGVRATVVNLSPSGTPEYHLSIQSTSLGETDIRLTGDGTDLLDTATGGSQARYLVNGRVEESKSNSRTITLSTGLTVDLLRDDAKAVTIEVTRGSTSVKTAIDAFINTYNGVIDELNKHYGTQKGALSGNSLVFGVNDVMRRISGYAAGDSGMPSLASIGITADKFGKLSLDSDEWDKVKGNLTGLKEFMGKMNDSGFLKAASDDLNSLQDTTTGLLKTTMTSMDDQLKAADDRIAEEQRRIDDLKESLQKRFFAADALIASLEQQATYFTNMFAAMKTNQDSMNG
jgi:flagellar hook-associated protein 2